MLRDDKPRYLNNRINKTESQDPPTLTIKLKMAPVKMADWDKCGGGRVMGQNLTKMVVGLVMEPLYAQNPTMNSFVNHSTSLKK